MRRFIAALLVSALAAFACVIVTTGKPTKAGRHFTAMARFQQKPVAGLWMHLDAPDGTRRASAQSGPNGVAEFRNIAPGSYVLRTADPGQMESIDVDALIPAVRQVSFKWPATKLLRAQALRGTVDAQAAFPGEVTTELLDALTGKVLATNPDPGDAFDFSNLAPGLYFLRFAPGLVIPVELSPNAPAGALTLELTRWDCGINFLDRRECNTSPLRLSRVTGTVADESGAIIGNARVTLADNDGHVVASNSTSDGHFDLNFTQPGTYRLTVVSPGFLALRHPMILDGSPGRLSVTLGILNRCSSATIQ